MHRKNRDRRLSVLAASAASVMAMTSGASAATVVWDGGPGGTGTAWNQAVNWAGDVLPTSADVVQFTNVGTSTGKIISLNAPQTIYQLSLQPFSNVPAFTIGSAADVSAGNTLTLTNVYRGNDVGNIQTIAANVVLAADSLWNIVTGYNGSVAVSGGISSGSAVTLTKAGTNTLTFSGANTFSGNLRVLNGNIALNNSNTYTGTTTSSGGGIIINFAAVNSTNFINSSSGLVLGGTSGGGSVTFNGRNTANAVNSQAFNGVTLEAGTSALAIVNGIASGKTAVNLGGITRNVGGTINFAQPTINTAISAQNGYLTSTGNDAGGILGGYATVGNTDWARIDGSNVVVAYTTYTNDAWAAGNNTTVTSSSSLAADSTTHSLRFAAAGANTLTLSGTNTIDSGGILVTSTVGNNLSTIAGGTLRGASGKDLVVIQNNGSNSLTIASAITDNTTATGLTKSGAGQLNLTGSLSYTGRTTVNAGTLALNASSVDPLSTASGITVTGGTLNLGTGTTQTMSGSVILMGGAISNGTLTKSGANFDVRNGTLSSKLAGNVGLDKTTPGSVTLSNTTHNTYTGDTTVTEGSLVGGGGGNFISVSGNLIVGSLGGGNPASYSNSGSTTAFNTGRTVTVYSNGSVNFGGGAQSLNGSTVNIVGGSVTGSQIYTHSNTVWNLTGGLLSGAVYNADATFNILASPNTSTISATLNLNETFNVADGAAAIDLAFTGTMSAARNMTKSGAGLMFASSNNGHTGFTNITGGTLRVASLANGGVNSSIGAATSAATNLRLGNGTTLQYAGSGANTDRGFTINGTLAGHSATLDASGTGAVNFTNTASPAYGTSNQTRLLTLTGTNAGDNTLAANIADNGSGAVSLTKNGTGKWILTGTNAYTGPTTINGGTLIVNGSLAAASTVIINGGTIGGSGTINGTVSMTGGSIVGSPTFSTPLNVPVGATLAPGNSAGTVTVANNVTLAGTSEFELDGNASLGTYDKLVQTGPNRSLTYGGSLVLSFLATPTGAGTYNLFSGSASHSGAFSSITAPAAPQGLLWHDFDSQTSGIQYFDYSTGSVQLDAAITAQFAAAGTNTFGTVGSTTIIGTSGNYAPGNVTVADGDATKNQGTADFTVSPAAPLSPSPSYVLIDLADANATELKASLLSALLEADINATIADPILATYQYLHTYDLMITLASPAGASFQFEYDFSSVAGFGAGTNVVQNIAVVPEPGTLGLLGAGVIGLIGRRRRRIES